MTDQFAACRDEERLSRDLADVLNRHSCENSSDTPDFILADYLVSCLRAWNAASAGRARWYGNGQEGALTDFDNEPAASPQVQGRAET